MSHLSTWQSREAKNFNGGLAPRNGVVIETFWDTSQDIACVAADFTNHVYVFIARSCFQTTSATETRSQYYKDERPYGIFESIQFECNRMNVVKSKVARHIKRTELENRGDNIFLVKSRCVFSPDDPVRCHTEIAGEVPCARYQYSRNIVRNVSCLCWLRFNYRAGKFADLSLERPMIEAEIKYTLWDVIGIDSEGLEFAYTAPWNSRVPRPMPPPKCLDVLPIEDDTRINKYINRLAYHLTMQLIYCPEVPKIPIRLSWFSYVGVLRKSKREIEPLDAMNLDIREYPLINGYIAYDAAHTVHEPLHATYHRTIDCEFYLMSNLTPIECCPGFFYFPYKQGVVHDLFGFLRDYYIKSTMAYNVRIFYKDPDLASYTPLYVYKDQISDDFSLVGTYFLGMCIRKDEDDVEIYSALFHDCKITMTYKDESERGIAIGDICEFFVYDVDRIMNGKCLHLYVFVSKYDGHHLACIEGSSIEFYLELNVLRKPVMMAFDQVLGAIGMTEDVVDKVPGLKNHFYAIVKFHTFEGRQEDNIQLRPYVFRVSREGDEKRFA